MDQPPVKNRRKKKFFRCLQPVVADDEPIFETASLQSFSDDEYRRKTKRRSSSSRGYRSLSGAFKNVFLMTSLVKKMKGKRSKDGSCKSSSVFSSKSENSVAYIKKNYLLDQEDIFGSNSNGSPLFTPSDTSVTNPSSISSSMSSRSVSERIGGATSLDSKPSFMKRDLSRSKCDFSFSRRGMCICVACLAALVIWGKVFAIMVCTSSWLYFAPSQRVIKRLESSRFEGFDSEEYKKKVIMEGLLERNRRPPPRVS